MLRVPLDGAFYYRIILGRMLGISFTRYIHVEPNRYPSSVGLIASQKFYKQ